ncbi:MAG TPA: DUF1254 domain-containing protein [Gemmatimonadaceae bacterium]|jgi:hypothetical protein|nr:DUF1254 domain-containing protein [Gemmatimonadaceae bacterium]
MSNPFCRAGALAMFASAVAVNSCKKVGAEVGATNEPQQTAVDAYVYGYSLVTMDQTRRVMTNVETAGDKHAPMGQFANMPSYPTAEFRDVTAPNANTLYSVAWVDLSAEPYVLSLPDEHDRYYLMPMLDAWTNVFRAPRTRTSGTGAQRYVIAGPHWSGTPNIPNATLRAVSAILRWSAEDSPTPRPQWRGPAPSPPQDLDELHLGRHSTYCM